MHADIVGIAPDPVTQVGPGEHEANGRLLAYASRAGQPSPAYAPQAGQPRPTYARPAGPQPLRRAVTTTDLPCRSDPELFFAEAPEDVLLAKTLCGLCPVRQACLTGALQRGEPCGVWGGELFLRGAIIASKRARGRPRKSAPAA